MANSSRSMAPLRRESVSLSGWGRFVTPQAACWSSSLTSISPRMNGAVNPERVLLANIIQYLGAPAPLPPAIANVITNVGRPYSVAVHDGHAYVADPKAHTVWKVNLTTAARTAVAGVGWKTDLDPQDLQGYNGDGIEATEAQLDNPSGVAVDLPRHPLHRGHWRPRDPKDAAGANFITTVVGIPTSFAVGEPRGCLRRGPWQSTQPETSTSRT